MYAYINIKQKLKSKCSNLNEKRKPAEFKAFISLVQVWLYLSQDIFNCQQLKYLCSSILERWGGEVPALQSIVKCVYVYVVDACMTEILMLLLSKTWCIEYRTVVV